MKIDKADPFNIVFLLSLILNKRLEDVNTNFPHFLMQAEALLKNRGRIIPNNWDVEELLSRSDFNGLFILSCKVLGIRYTAERILPEFLSEDGDRIKEAINLIGRGILPCERY